MKLEQEELLNKRKRFDYLCLKTNVRELTQDERKELNALITLNLPQHSYWYNLPEAVALREKQREKQRQRDVDITNKALDKYW